MEKKDFLPVILGTDSNAYGMAKAFHQAYGIKSLVVGQGNLFTTTGSKILTIEIIEDFANPAVFSKALLSIAERLKTSYKKLILIASSDGYVELIVNHKHLLEEAYEVPFIDKDLMETLNSKEGFYKTCDAYGLPYPSTLVIHPSTDKETLKKLPFAYPVVLKPSDSMRYFEAHFEGKKKAYIIDHEKELFDVIDLIYRSTYDAPMILQEYITGDDTAMRVLNCVSGPDGKVRLMCLGQPLLEDCTPTLVGNYTAIIDAYDETIFADYKKFLERIGYVGFSNFDLKYDASSKTYKVFEINLRQGRSSYFVTGSGYNQAAFLVDAFINRKMDETIYGSRPHLWLGIPKKVLIAYLEEGALKEKARMRIKNKQTSTTLYYSKDINIMRLLRVYRYYDSYKAKFKMYFTKKK